MRIILGTAHTICICALVRITTPPKLIRLRLIYIYWYSWPEISVGL